jgi:hypothetical protein
MGENNLYLVDNFLGDWRTEILPAFEQLPGGASAYNKDYAEVWQYMGTVERVVNDRGTQLVLYFHQFRHRAFPTSNQRLYKEVTASAGWEPAPEMLVNLTPYQRGH